MHTYLIFLATTEVSVTSNLMISCLLTTLQMDDHEIWATNTISGRSCVMFHQASKKRVHLCKVLENIRLLLSSSLQSILELRLQTNKNLYVHIKGKSD